MMDPDHGEHQEDHLASFRVDHLVQLSNNNDPTNLNVSFLPLPGEIMIENNITVNVEEEDITEAIVQKVRDLLTAAQADDTVQDIIEDLPGQEVLIKVHTTAKPKSGKDLFKELIANMESNLETNKENGDYLNYAYSDTEYDTGNVDYTDYYTESDNSHSQEYYDYQENVPNGIDADDLLRGDSNEIKYNIDLTYNEDPSSSDKYTTTEAPNYAFPELLRDLMIFNEIEDIPVKEIEQKKNKDFKISTKYLNFVAKTRNPSKDFPIKNARKDFVLEEKVAENIIPEENLENTADENNRKEDFNNLLVHTSGGRILGKEIMISTGSVVKEYLGIPYARPPTGPLRFKPPQPPLMWNNVRKTITEQPRCWNSFSSNSWEVGSLVTTHSLSSIPRPTSPACLRTVSTCLSGHQGHPPRQE